MNLKLFCTQVICVACVVSGATAGSFNGSYSRYPDSHSSPPIYDISVPATPRCEGPLPPIQGSVSCKITSIRYMCRGNCYAGYGFPGGKAFYDLECSQATGLWKPNRKVPDCVVSQGSGYRGTYFEGTLNTFQDAVSSELVGRNILCSNPKTPMNGSRRCKMSNGQWLCTGTCNSGYGFPDGTHQAILKCNDRDGQWSPKKDFDDCRPSQGNKNREVSGAGTLQTFHKLASSEQGVRPRPICTVAQIPMNGNRQCSKSNGQWSCKVTCNTGYHFPDGSGQAIFTCNDRDGQWYPKKEFDDCIRTVQSFHGELSSEQALQGNGYRTMSSQGTPQSLHGQLPSEQAGQAPVRNYCGTLKSPMNGIKHCNRLNGQWSCKGTCLGGFKFPDGSNQTTVTCKDSNGQWFPKKHFDDCIQSSCVRPKPVLHGRIKCERGVGVKTCKGSCMPGYIFKGGSREVTIRCLRRTGKWTPAEVFPECAPICSPECKSGGKCVGPNVCLCPTDYQGSRCEYQKSVTNAISHKYENAKGNEQLYPLQRDGSSYHSNPRDQTQSRFGNSYTKERVNSAVNGFERGGRQQPGSVNGGHWNTEENFGGQQRAGHGQKANLHDSDGLQQIRHPYIDQQRTGQGLSGQQTFGYASNRQRQM